MPVPLQTLARNAPNVVACDNGGEAVVIVSETLTVIDEVCPHMGGPLGRGHYCSKSRRLTCPWHGYVFSTVDLALVDNPNEKIWIAPLAADAAAFPKPPLKLRSLAHTIVNGILAVRR